jgi:hypothetical protein
MRSLQAVITFAPVRHRIAVKREQTGSSILTLDRASMPTELLLLRRAPG